MCATQPTGCRTAAEQLTAPGPPHTSPLAPHPNPVCPKPQPTQLSESTLAAARSAVKAATALWGSQTLPLLEAEDRLSVACEKGDTADEVLLQLRGAYQVRGSGFRV